MEKMAALLLFFIVMPEALEKILSIVKLFSGQHIEIEHRLIEVVITWFLKAVGFYSLYTSINRITVAKFNKIAIAVILSFYVTAEALSVIFWIDSGPGNGPIMKPVFLWTFSVAKILITGFYVLTMLNNCVEYRRMGWGKRIGIFSKHFFH